MLNLASLPLAPSPGRGGRLEFFQGAVHAAEDVFGLEVPRIEAFTLVVGTPAIPPPGAWRARFPTLTHLRLEGAAAPASSQHAAEFAAQGITLT
ncbi:MAG: hypothetical protein MUC96_22955 [Myxococcaceae bacterium]|nr:hypothetical protein [Myxococcaceae bacterium]